MNRRGEQIRALVLSSGLAASACGGKTSLETDGAGTETPVIECSDAMACGGELVGTWRAVALCTDLAHVSAVSGCEILGTSQVSPLISGSRTYSADGTYSVTLRYGGSLTLLMPARCVDSPVAHYACRVMEAGIVTRGEKFVRSADCVTAGDNCSCDVELLPYEWRDSGRWSSTNGRVLESTGGEGEYCVEGGELRLTTASGALGSAETIVFVAD